MKNLRRIALEYEFIALHADGSAVDRADILKLWEYFLELGWNAKRDVYNGESLGVYQETPAGKVVIDNDGGPCLLEIAWPPHHDLAKAKEDFIRVVNLVSGHFGTKYRLVGYGTAPFTDPATVTLTPKSHYSVLQTIAQPGAYAPFYISGASQFNLDGTLDELMRAENVFLQLTGVLVALSANSSIYQATVTDYKEKRLYYYDILQSKMIPAYRDSIGIPAKAFSSWQEYFHFLLNRPARLLFSDGKMYEGIDDRPMVDILKDNGKVRLRELVRTHFATPEEKQAYSAYQRETELPLTPQIIWLTQAFVWPDSRLKFGFNETMEGDFRSAFFGTSEGFDRWLGDNLAYKYLEIRPVSTQLPEEQLTMPAFALGIMEHLGEAEKLLSTQPWDFWRAMRVQAYTEGMDGQVGGVPIGEYLVPFYEIALKGLQKRGVGEERYLLPLSERIKNHITPTEIAEKALREGSQQGLLERITITNDDLLKIRH